MPQEIETKILNVDAAAIATSLEKLGARRVLETRFFVDWYHAPGTKEGEEPWYLRIRKTSDGKVELTWKGKSDKLGAARSHEEINFGVSDSARAGEFLKALGLECYAHQDKDRTSWVLQDWRFDLDQYPGMPAYLEIEGKSEEHVQEALKLLDLQNHETSNEGERVLIQTKYALDWYKMKF